MDSFNKSTIRTCIVLTVVAWTTATAPASTVARVALSPRLQSLAAAKPYTILNLSALVGKPVQFVPTALDNLGQIAGYDFTIRSTASGYRTPGAAYVIDADRTVHVLQNTGSSPDAYIPTAISSSGRSIAGEETSLETFATGPATWHLTATKAYGLNYRRYIDADIPITGLNDADLAVGGPDSYTVARYSVTPFPTAGCALGLFFANAVNGAGTIVGNADGYAAADTPTGCSTYLPGLPRPANTSTSAIAINAHGSLLGLVVGPAAPAYGAAYLFAGGRLTRLTLPAAYASATYYVSAVALSDADAVVGNVVQEAPPFTPVAPFLYQNGRAIDVNSLLPAKSGWRLVTAAAVNASGEIVGTGYYGGVLTGYALLP